MVRHLIYQRKKLTFKICSDNWHRNIVKLLASLVTLHMMHKLKLISSFQEKESSSGPFHQVHLFGLLKFDRTTTNLGPL